MFLTMTVANFGLLLTTPAFRLWSVFTMEGFMFEKPEFGSESSDQLSQVLFMAF